MPRPCWFVVLAQEIKALIWHRYPALIWINCTEWEVLCSSLAFGQHIEKCGFPVVNMERSISKTLVHSHNTHMNIDILDVDTPNNAHVPHIRKTHNSDFQRGPKSSNQRRLFRSFSLFGGHLRVLQVRYIISLGQSITQNQMLCTNIVIGLTVISGYFLLCKLILLG